MKDKYTDDYIDELIDDDYSEEEIDDILDEEEIGQNEFERTKQNSDYYKNRAEELDNELNNAKEEAKKDTMDVKDPNAKNGESKESNQNENNVSKDSSNELNNNYINNNQNNQTNNVPTQSQNNQSQDNIPKNPEAIGYDNKPKQNHDNLESNPNHNNMQGVTNQKPSSPNSSLNDNHNNESQNPNTSNNQNETQKKEQEENQNINSTPENQGNNQNNQNNVSKEQKNENKDNKEDEEQKDNKGRKIVRRNDNGTMTVEKNKKDHKRDQKNIKQAQRNVRRNKIDNAKSKLSQAKHPIESTKEKIKEKLKRKLVITLVSNLPTIVGAGVMILIMVLLYLVVMTVVIIIGGGSKSGDVDLGYYDASCSQVVVVSEEDEDGEMIVLGTFTIEEYVAGVLASEVGDAENMEVYKAFAIAIRTYLFNEMDEETCSIENGSEFPTFESTNNLVYISAANETKGMVISDDEGELLDTSFDSCNIISEDAENITIAQKNQVIPKSWYSENQSKFVTGGNEEGMSKCGAYYLGDNDYDYEAILNYYFDEYVFLNSYLAVTLEGIPDYEFSSSSSVIYRSDEGISELLRENGSSIEELNALIKENVEEAGYGTRAGVVAAAVTLIGEMNKYDYRIPYFWGGGHGTNAIREGAYANWGSNKCTTYANGNLYKGCGLDCSGFISWAIYNGGYNFSTSGSAAFQTIGELVDLDEDNQELQPGDILYKPRNGEISGHVALVIAVDPESKQYVTAEAMGNAYGILFSRRSFAPENYQGLRMDNYYNDSNNVR